MHGFYRVAAAAPAVRIADVGHNAGRVIALMREAEAEHAAVILFPEMSLTGYTCGDLFHQSTLLAAAETALSHIAAETAYLRVAAVVGAPLIRGNAVYNCGIVICAGRILGVVPKTYNPGYREFYEKRWFSSGIDADGGVISLEGYEVPFGTDLIFSHDRYFRFGLEICEDLWAVVPPSSWHCIAGALLTLNLSASNELVAKADYRRELIRQQSARCISGYVYASSGVHESTQDLVFGGHLMIAENGRCVTENYRFQRRDQIIYADIDCQRLLSSRLSESSYADAALPAGRVFRDIRVGEINRIPLLKYTEVSPTPFVPPAKDSRDARCAEIFHIQAAALARRLEHTGMKTAVVGISGGLDSTLALLVCVETFRLLEMSPENIIAVTMPGFGTSGRTLNNARLLCRHLNVGLLEIDIKPACLQHFHDIGHDPEKHDVTYENVQARERTQILMDIANREHGLVVGTGDLSEIALGWSTYNADHMSMYAVNCGVPKTLIRYLIHWVADSSAYDLAAVLADIINTPVSPELLPGDGENAISQKTEDILGSYELHDFFLYHLIKYGAPPDKIRFLAAQAFGGKYPPEEIDRTLELFIKRFFMQQFKRSCIPDGPKVGTVCLSPRGDWRMPSDAAWTEWINRLSPR